MKNIKFPLVILLFLFSLSLFSFSGCAAGAPPASIPAPVSGLLSASAPGAGGAVTITGQDGSVVPNATVEAVNLTQGASFFELGLLDLLLPSAHAQIFSAETQADDMGAFVLFIDGFNGDVIAVRQIVGGDVSPSTTVTVP